MCPYVFTFFVAVLFLFSFLYRFIVNKDEYWKLCVTGPLR